MNSVIRSAVYSGRVMHQRLRPARHRLDYRMFSLLLDLDELPALSERLRLFSFDRFNVFSLRQSDHGDGGTGRGALRAHVERQLLAAGLQPGGRIELLCMPRILGRVFNPLSVYFCHLPGASGDAPDDALQAILYEVNNTFGERHSYLIPVAAAQRGAGIIEQSCAKRLHVSPFMALAMDYGFRIEPPAPHSAGLRISVQVSDAEGPVLHAALRAERRPLGDRMLARMLLAQPLLAFTVLAAIHWEALRLWLKRVPWHRQPAAPACPVTIVESQEQ